MFDKIQIKFVHKQNGLWDVFIRGFDGVTKIIASDIKEDVARLLIEIEEPGRENNECIEVAVEE